MLKEKTLYSLKDICIIPAVITNIVSRSECMPYKRGITNTGNKLYRKEQSYYPLITAPMDFIDDINFHEFEDNKISTILPRTLSFEKRISYVSSVFCAFSIKECRDLIENSPEYGLENKEDSIYVLIDIANGTMEEELKVGKELKSKFGNRLKLMGGNIGNPYTYLLYDQAGFDFLRVGIGDGAGCLTSYQLGVSYPYASLISEISELKYRYHSHCKIIADGGMSCYSDIIKCLALGADYVMCGKLFAQAALKGEHVGSHFIYRGMSTKSAQKDMGNTQLKTAEGRTLQLVKEYTLTGWIENFDSYLRSAMSYCDSRCLTEFREKAVCQIVSPSASYKINNK